MGNNFDYWIKNDVRKFLIRYWVQYSLFYIYSIWAAVRARNLIVFFVIGFLPYLTILIFRRFHNPFKSIEDGIKKYNASLYEHLSRRIPEKHGRRPKYRAISIYGLFMREPEAKLDADLLAFKKNFNRINTHADLSLSLWFFTCIAIAIYLYLTRS